MARSADPEKQAQRAIRALDAIGTPRHGNTADGKIHSRGTARLYRQVFKTAAARCNEKFKTQLYHLSIDQAKTYLDERSNDIGQKQLNNERRALEMFLRHVRGDASLTIGYVHSEIPAIEKARAYTDAQVALLASFQSPRLSLSTRIADEAGLRAAELYTLRRIEERKPSAHRSWSPDCYRGREDWVRYTVKGKGGLVREVRLSPSLARELEARRLESPKTIHDRGIKLTTRYDLSGGKNFSNRFSETALKVMGWSEGAHGLRHSYAQRRIDELQGNGCRYPQALGIVSQELGHFRPDITEVYLR